MAESYIQHATDGAGKRVRTLQLSVLQSDGTFQTVHLQVASISDIEGNVISPIPDRELLRDLKFEARIQTEVLLRILAAIEPGEETDRDAIIDELEDYSNDADNESAGEEK